MKKLFILICIATSALQIHAQNSDIHNNLTVNIGMQDYVGKLGNGFTGGIGYYGFLGLSYSHFINNKWDFNLNGSYGELGFLTKNDVSYFRCVTNDLSLGFRYKFLNTEKNKLIPYLTPAIGVFWINKYTFKESKFTYFSPSLAVGIKYMISKHFELNLQENMVVFTLPATLNSSQHFTFDFQTSLGIGYNFGCKKHTNTPAPVLIDKISDKDKDGIPDYLDKCPDIAGIALFNGCPDTDGDGIPDSEDKCPNVKGIALFSGCPDTDGDGIPDSEDKCPNLKGIALFNGCPDTDGDGIPDLEDRCPTVKGSAALNGCPDTDGDGIADIDDKCPNVPGIKENKGCPEIKEEVKKVFEQALTGIQFESGKDVIKKSSYPILDNVVKIMKDNPSYTIEINGHTDDQGDDAKNMILSQNRANAVKKYISDRNVAENRMIPKGFGETMPIADNKTPEGRAKNRRVEFKVVY